MVSVTLDASDIGKAIVFLDPIFTFEPGLMTEAIGALGESQTRRRIEIEKTAPDGTPWVDNLEGTSILRRTGRNLLDSAAYTASAEEAEWGLGWEFAHVHQNGMTIVPREAEKLVFEIGGKKVAASEVTIPARPIVGLSDDNRAEILDLVTDVLGLAR